MENLYVCDIQNQMTYHLSSVDRNTADRIFALCDLEGYCYIFVYSLQEAEEIGYPIQEVDSYV